VGGRVVVQRPQDRRERPLLADLVEVGAHQGRGAGGNDVQLLGQDPPGLGRGREQEVGAACNGSGIGDGAERDADKATVRLWLEL
jgi:hypothetical protein